MSSHAVKTQESCLIFQMNDTYYGIFTIHIVEILELPDLKSLPNFPEYFAGMLDYKGKTIPVIDGRISLGLNFDYYSATDVVIVIKEADEHFGIILSQVIDIEDVELVEEAHFSQYIVNHKTTFPIISEVGKYRENLLFIFGTIALKGEVNALFEIDYSSEESQLMLSHQQSLSGKASFFHKRIPEHLEEEFALRANRLMVEKDLAKEHLKSAISLTILTIHDRQFIIESERIKEFCYVGSYSSIPNNIKLLGFMNLRGSIVPLVDIWFILHNQHSVIEPLDKVLVINFSDEVIGFVVKDADKIVTIDKSELLDLPIDYEAAEEKYIKHVVKIEDQLVGILDIDSLLEAII